MPCTLNLAFLYGKVLLSKQSYEFNAGFWHSSAQPGGATTPKTCSQALLFHSLTGFHDGSTNLLISLLTFSVKVAGEVISELIICHFKICCSELVLSWMETKFGVQTLHGKCYLPIKPWCSGNFWSSETNKTALMKFISSIRIPPLQPYENDNFDLAITLLTSYKPNFKWYLRKLHVAPSRLRLTWSWERTVALSCAQWDWDVPEKSNKFHQYCLVSFAAPEVTRTSRLDA